MRLWLLLLLITGFSAAAQSTRTSLSGSIKDAEGRIVSGASLSLTHLPTQTVYGCASNFSGAYQISDVKSGGPYLLEVTYTGLLPYRQEHLYLKLDEPLVIHIVLGEQVKILAEVKVSALRTSAIQQKNTDIGTLNLDKTAINTLPSIRRGITDFTRLSPYAFGSAIAGGNYRQNFITIDGSEFNNNFGVGDNLPGNGAQPISLEAIEEFSLNPAPYSAIWASGFIGSALNITTRSGSNQLQAAGYTYFRNENSYGYQPGGVQLDKRPMDYKLYGFRLGGPVIKNRLFYFFSFEQEKEIYQPQAFQAATLDNPYGSSANTARPTTFALDEIRHYLLDSYGYQAGDYQGYDFKNRSQKFLIRADWNIAKNNTLTLRYNQLNSTRPEMLNGSRSPLTPFAASAGRRTINALSFSNSNFSTRSAFYSLALEWDYKLSGALSNMLRTSYTVQNEQRESESNPFPFVDILKDGIPYTSFGYEPYSYANRRKVALSSISDILHWKPGRNSWDAGFQFDYMDTRNSYMPFGTGYYTFASWDDFKNGAKPQDYALTYSTNADQSPPVYAFDYLNVSGFLQHNVSLGTRGMMHFGLRADISGFPKSLPQHPGLSRLVFAGSEQVNTSRLPASDILLSPRLSFNYKLFKQSSLLLRGGTGIFTGRIPFVWIISQARYSGVGQISQTWQGQVNTPHAFNPNPEFQVNGNQKEVVPSVSSMLSSDFKMPQSWKSSLGLEGIFVGGIRLSVDAIYNKDIRTIVFRDINLVTPTRMNIAGYEDHRLIYPQKNQMKFINPLNSAGQPDPNGTSAMNMVKIANSSGGYYFSALFSLNKKFKSGAELSFSYIRSTARNYNDGDGDQTLSALNATPTVDGINNPALSYASYVVPGRIVSTVNYPIEVSKALRLNVSLVYQGSAEGRFSYTYSRDLIGDGTNRSLIYVPKDASGISFDPLKVLLNGKEVIYIEEAQKQAFINYINQDAYLKNKKGQYAERNGAMLPWRNQLDFRFAAAFFVKPKVNKHRLELSVDVMNMGNLFNNNWGLKKLPNSSALLIPVNLDKITANGTILPRFNMATVGGKLITESFRSDNSLNSSYTIQMGLRYIWE
ncbi:carboxypeptidase-like regulatory domain-containing protein [Pedobacter aquatilis]|uniref:TonB-dependent receptor n=1 Tax=Pedobacter aquatilis TaxID=351343 RepID=UPI0029302B2D|nr:carboxypeptidase-like regulatory domain-containing protein [Pedobacter aquatilis]